MVTLDVFKTLLKYPWIYGFKIFMDFVMSKTSNLYILNIFLKLCCLSG